MIRAKKHLGQHFLHDKRVTERIAALVLPPQEGAVFEVGPGTGALTACLLARGFSIVAIEKDPEAVAYLTQRFTENKQLKVIQGDVLTIDFQKDSNTTWVGNLPYNISGPFFFQIAVAYNCIRQGVFMIQQEVAQRLISPPGSKNYGILSVLLGYGFEVSLEFRVGAGAFSPPPKVTSAVITLLPRPHPSPCVKNWADFCYIVKQAFHQRRKMLRNTLACLGDQLPENLRQCRAEELSIADFVSLANSYTEAKAEQ